jgi:uncharacterized protein YdaU (DUF1376 family)
MWVMKAPAFQFYPKQWLGDDKVMLMDWDARAMHLHLMCVAWQQEDPCSLPDDDDLLRKWVGNPKDWQRIKTQVFRAWKLENSRWIQLGLLREYEKQSKFSESRKSNAFKRWDKIDKKESNASAMQVQCTADALQSSSSFTTTKNNPPTPRKNRGVTYTDDFLTFWNTYPKKVGKDAAWRAWKARNGTRPALADLVTAISKQTQSDQWQKENGQFIPNPATWLNQGRWADEIDTPEGSIDAWARKKQAEMEAEKNGTV